MPISIPPSEEQSVNDELAAFYSDFFQDVLIEAEADGEFAEDAFFDRFSAELVDAGEIETADRTHFTGQRGLRVDGYGGDPLASNGTLSVLIVDFNTTPIIETLTKTELDAIFKRASNFVRKARDAEFRDSLEESNPAFGLADMIAARWDRTARIRLILMSNRQLSARIDGLADAEIDGIQVTQNVWDIERLWRYVTAGSGREELTVDFANDFGGTIPLLPAHFEGAGYESYLAVVPGRQLAAIYDRWGARLLEQNVRVFLQARGNVNKGIRQTLENEPEMFFAYNNGITATAEGIKTTMTPDGLALSEISNFQIVNGGQTTASVHKAMLDKVSLSRVFVQMKLSIVDPVKSETVVPLISQYANSQNRVNAADFFSNHPFHVRLEEFSRRIYAPSIDGALRETKWFYERARGQYQDARGRLSVAAQKKFELEYPKAQVFTKTDLAKFQTVWECRPDLVSRGAQKNFALFAEFIGKKWDKNSDAFNEFYYKETIAKAIVFKRLEKLIPLQPWYEGGYRANIVAYAISKVAFDVKTLAKHVNLMSVWQAQVIAKSMEDALLTAGFEANQVLTNPPPSHHNVTEWAKQQACWERISAVKVAWSNEFLESLIDSKQQTAHIKEASNLQKVDNSINAQTLVVNAGPELWRQVRAWGINRKVLSERDQGILGTCASIPAQIPTDKQCEAALKTLRRLHGDGCRIGLDLFQ